MPRYYRAVALDLDGTLASGGRPEERVVEAIRATRAAGTRTVLVTGRILAELEADMPRLVEEFDAVVAENGAVLAVGAVATPLAEPVAPALAERLREHGVAVRRGQVLLACDGSGAHLAVEAVHAMGLDVQLVWNRASLMLLPSGVTKGTGVRAGLAALGISPHSVLAIGDAENDHALLQACELGVAVANAVPALTEHADLVLPRPDGGGVVDLLEGPVMRGTQMVRSRRWQLLLGTGEDGREVTIPASRTNILITGDTGSGKSYVTGLLAEQMIDLGYSALVIDPEGDHTELGSLRNTLLVGDDGRLPPPEELVRILDHERSVVLDLSLASPPDLSGYLCNVHRELRAHRERTGLPHWLVIDEAHRPLGLESAEHDWGYCLSTYRPDWLATQTVATMGWQLRMSNQRPGEGILTVADGGDQTTRVRIAPRATPHVRHHHKYTDGDLPAERGFHFRDERGPTGAVAVNLRQFLAEVGRCDPTVIRHHTAGRDFSRWVREVLGDPVLPERIRRLEAQPTDDGSVESIRAGLLNLTTSRYGLHQS